MEKKPQKSKGKKRQQQGSISEESPKAKNLKLDSLLLAEAKPHAATQKHDAKPKPAVGQNIAPKLENGIQKPKKNKKRGNKKNAHASPAIENKVQDVPIPAMNTKKEKIKTAGVLLANNKNSKPIPEVKSEAIKSEASDNDDTSENEKSTMDTSINTDQENIYDKYPVLKNTELTGRFLKVPMNNNQKGRIRQAVKLKVQGTSNTMNPDIINGIIQDMLKGKQISELSDPDLRRLRILHNLLKTVLTNPSDKQIVEKAVKKNNSSPKKGNHEKEGNQEKVKGPKRYVAFIGNLPLDINKEMIMEHFRELDEHIKDVRIPAIKEGKKSAIAFIELANDVSFELALSKNHSMLDNKRIKVLYSTQQNSKISKAEAKSTSAKLVALQKSGKLVGSTPLSKKRSHRRNIMKQAQDKEAAASA